MVTIIKSAIMVDNKIYTGFDHGECFKQLDNPAITMTDIQQGFLTSKGEFVDRKQAMIIAKEAGQYNDLGLGKETLISEDLHLNWLHKQDHENKILSKALELACREADNLLIKHEGWRFGLASENNFDKYFELEQKGLEIQGHCDYFKQQAEKEIKNE